MSTLQCRAGGIISSWAGKCEVQHDRLSIVLRVLQTPSPYPVNQVQELRKMTAIAWYDPSNGVVSTDRDCPLFTPLGQVWALHPRREWVGLTEAQRIDIIDEEITTQNMEHFALAQAIEQALKEQNA